MPPKAKPQLICSAAASAAHLDHGVAHRRAHRGGGVVPVRRGEPSPDTGSSAEHQPPLRPLAPNPATCASTTSDASDGSASQQVVRGPQPGEPGADDRDVGLGVAVERVRRGSAASSWSNQSERGARQRRAHASVSTPRRICSISSNSAWPQISGGASWMTGSPRSSARQYRPASNRALDRKPRSRRSDSSSLKVSLVALSLTSSMP